MGSVLEMLKRKAIVNPEVLKELGHDRAMAYNDRNKVGCPQKFYAQICAEMKNSRILRGLQSYTRKFSLQKIATKYLQTVNYLQKTVDDVNNFIVKETNNMIRNAKSQYIKKIAENVNERFLGMQKGEQLEKVPVPVSKNEGWRPGR